MQQSNVLNFCAISLSLCLQKEIQKIQDNKISKFQKVNRKVSFERQNSSSMGGREF